MSSKLSPTMKQALAHFKEHGHFGAFRQPTIDALERREQVYRTDDGAYVLAQDETVTEMLGAAQPHPERYKVRFYDDIQPTRDWNRPDEVFWEKARRSKARGLELAGLFLKPLQSKAAAWVMGQKPQFKTEDEGLAEHLNGWWDDHHSDILRGYEESRGLGNTFLVVNPPDADGKLTVTILPPDVVEPMVDESDYSRLIGWRVTEIHPHPTRPFHRQKIVDEYTARERVRKVYTNGRLTRTERYRNLIGQIPVVLIPNHRGTNETFGRPDGEALLPVLQRYDDLLDAALIGNKKQGRPTPTIKLGTLQEIQMFMEKFGKLVQQEMPDGTVNEYYELQFTSDSAVVLPTSGAFSWESPGSFAGDTEKLLGLLFYLILQHTEFPEFIWGNAIASSKASAETQMPPFIKWVEKEQGRARHWVLSLLAIVTAYLSLYEGTPEKADVQIDWPSLTNEDGQLTLAAVQFGVSNGLIDDETALRLLPLDIENPAEVIQKAREEAEERRQQQEEAMLSRLEAQFAQDEEDAEPDEGEDTDDGEDEEDTAETASRLMLEAMGEALTNGVHP